MRCLCWSEAKRAMRTKIETQKGELVAMNRCDDMELLCVLDWCMLSWLFGGVIYVRGRDKCRE